MHHIDLLDEQPSEFPFVNSNHSLYVMSFPFPGCIRIWHSCSVSTLHGAQLDEGKTIGRGL